jgi:aminoglycoside 3-N-acetyltransferase
MSLTLSSLLSALRSLGVLPGDVSEVHTALSKFSQVEGGAKTEVDALIEAVGPSGVIVMTVYPSSVT